jgi:DNA-binding response OmpR family regulator
MAARRILERAGFRTLQAEDGREGVRVFRENAQQITAILLDLAMPHLSGEEAFREMRLLEPGVKVVLMSGYHEQEVTNLFAGMGLSGFVQKPFQARDLLTAFRRIQDR